MNEIIDYTKCKKKIFGVGTIFREVSRVNGYDYEYYQVVQGSITFGIFHQEWYDPKRLKVQKCKKYVYCTEPEACYNFNITKAYRLAEMFRYVLDETEQPFNYHETIYRRYIIEQNIFKNLLVKEY